MTKSETGPAPRRSDTLQSTPCGRALITRDLTRTTTTAVISVQHVEVYWVDVVLDQDT
jgi:hypothetical protein